MTTQIKFRIIVILAVLFMGSNSFSQSSNVENLQVSLSSISSGKSYSKIITQFEALFPNAQNVSFYNLKKNIGATFKINELKYRVLFSKNGRVLYKITYGKEALLPVEVRKMVKSEYVEFMITGAALVEEDNREIWVVNLEDDSKYVIASVENRELNENLIYKKRK